MAPSNFTLQQDAANYEEAREVARADRATFFPDLSAVGSAYRTHAPEASGLPTTTANAFSADLEATWAPDFWGRVRRQTEEDVTAAQATAAELASARLAAQTLLAQDYISLRATDEQRRLLDNAVAAYNRTLTITKNEYAVGVAARSDILAAQAQVDAARAQAINVGVQRAQLEHAIAVLVGQLPSEFSIPRQPAFTLAIPSVPPQMASQLLERRPDVASAERSVASANAKVGVQTAAYFPDITLSAEGGFEGSPLDRLFTAPFRMWSLGSNVSETLLDFGQRRAELLQARGAYDATVAGYRETVIVAFQQVEDNLAALRILAQEAQVEDTAVSEAADAARIAENEYKAGTENLIYVETAQVAEVTDRLQALATLQLRLTDAVALIQALGGGWRASDLPTRHQVLQRHSDDGAAIAAPK